MTTKLNALERLNKDESLKFVIKLCVVDTTIKESKKKIKTKKVILPSNWFSNVFEFSLLFEWSWNFSLLWLGFI